MRQPKAQDQDKRKQCLPSSMLPSASNVEQIALNLPSVVPQATQFCVCCATETPELFKDFSSHEHFLSSALQSKSSEWKSVSLSVQSSKPPRLNASNIGVSVSNVLQRSLLVGEACHQRPCDVYQSNFFELRLSSVLPLACFSKYFRRDFCQKRMGGFPALAPPVASSANVSEPAFNLWTSDTFTLEGGNCHYAAVDDFLS